MKQESLYLNNRKDLYNIDHHINKLYCSLYSSVLFLVCTQVTTRQILKVKLVTEVLTNNYNNNGKAAEAV